MNNLSSYFGYFFISITILLNFQKLYYTHHKSRNIRLFSTDHNVAWIDFTIVSSIDGIQPGTYNYNSGEELSALTWTDGSFGPTGLESIGITSGVLKIEKSGSSYTVTFTGKTDEDKDITMTYSGAISSFIID